MVSSVLISLALTAHPPLWDRAPRAPEATELRIAKRRKRRPRTKAQPTPTSPPAESEAPASVSDGFSVDPETARKATEDPRSTGEILQQAQRLYDDLEFDAVMPLARLVLARSDVTVTQRLDAYLLLGSSMAVARDPVGAETPFRFLLRGRPDFELPPTTPPKILAVFRKVQVEERTIREQLRELERERIIQSLELVAENNAEGKGGKPLTIAYTLRDPQRHVTSMRLNFRRRGEPTYSSLAMTREDGSWMVEVAGEWTESESDYVFEYYVTTLDADGELLRAGSAPAPLTLDVRAGRFQRPKPLYKQTWFWLASGAAAAAVGAAAYFYIANERDLPDGDITVPLD
ncbi:MAG: hypothetical protein AAF654_07620 [Myxococcota bacterium]